MMLQEMGLDQVKADGYTFSIKRSVKPSVVGGVEGVQALIEAGMIECTAVGWQRTGAVIREYLNSKIEENPLLSIDEAKAMFEDDNPALKGHVKVYEDYGVSMRKNT